MARFFQFDTYPVRTIIMDIEVQLPNGRKCLGAAHQQRSSYPTLAHHFDEVSLYGDHAPEQGTPLFAFAKGIVEAEARYESELRASEKNRTESIEKARMAYFEVLKAEAQQKAEASTREGDESPAPTLLLEAV